MPNISEELLEGIVFIINGCELLAIFHRLFKEPVKIDHLQKFVNQSRFNKALVIEIINTFFSESNKKFSRVLKRKIF